MEGRAKSANVYNLHASQSYVNEAVRKSERERERTKSEAAPGAQTGKNVS